MKLDIQMFADGKVVITADLNSTNFEKGLARMESTTNKAGNSIKNIVAGLGIAKLISSGINLINSNLDTAITRLDTLNNFPKVMENLGISTEKSQKSIDKLADKLTGLPTTLQDGAMAVQRLTSKNEDLEKSTEIFLAMNNAILAGGAPMENQKAALEQLTQAYSKGKPDLQEWRTLQMAMPGQLKQIAKAMGYVSDSELYEALKEGNVTMEQFMDTIMKLNVEGIDGFANFETQARSATDGINTAIVNMKTRVAQGLAAVIDSIDKGLKNSGMGGIAKVFENIGNAFRETLKKLATQISKIDFKKLIDSAKKLIPVIGSLVTGFVAYNTTLKGLKMATTISNFVKMTQKTGGLITALSSAKGGFIALNSAMAISPIGLLVAGVAGLTAGFYLLARAEAESANANTKISETLIDYDKSMKEANKARQEYLDTTMNEVQNTENLYNELQALVDENGRVKEGYEDRVNYIIGELSKATGTEIQMIDGQIQGYEDLKQSINDVIESKRVKTLLDAQEKVYNDAKDKAAILEKAYADAVKETNRLEDERQKKLKDIQKEYNLTGKQLEEVSQKLGYTDKNGKFVTIAFDDLGRSLIMTNSQLEQANGTLDQTGKKYAENQEVIGNYEQSLKNLSDGNYEAILKMYEDTTNYHAKTNEDTQANYDSAIESQQRYLDYLKSNKDKYDKDVYDAQVKATEDRIAQLQGEQQQMSATISTGQSIIKGNWRTGLSEQLSEITGHNIEFVKTGKGNIQAYIDGQKEGKPMSKKEAKEFAKDMENELKKINTKESGKDFVNGFGNGINEHKGGAFNIISSFGNDILNTFRGSLKEHSPSRATKEMGINLVKGAEIGIDQEKTKALKQVDQFGNEMLKRINNTMNVEMSKIQANVETGKVFNTLANTTPVYVHVDADVEMDNTKVGRIITPVVSETLKTGGLR